MLSKELRGEFRFTVLANHFWGDTLVGTVNFYFSAFVDPGESWELSSSSRLWKLLEGE